MSELKPKIYDEANGLDYALVGDYYIPAIELPEDDDRPIGKWGRMHWAHLEKTNPLLLNHLTLTGRLHTYLADLNEQAQNRYRCIVRQMAEDEGNHSARTNLHIIGISTPAFALAGKCKALERFSILASLSRVFSFAHMPSSVDN